MGEVKGQIVYPISNWCTAIFSHFVATRGLNLANVAKKQINSEQPPSKCTNQVWIGLFFQRLNHHLTQHSLLLPCYSLLLKNIVTWLKIMLCYTYPASFENQNEKVIMLTNSSGINEHEDIDQNDPYATPPKIVHVKAILKVWWIKRKSLLIYRVNELNWH